MAGPGNSTARQRRGQRNRWLPVATIVVLFLMALALAACGGGGSSSSESTESAEPAETAESTEEGAATEEGEAAEEGEASTVSSGVGKEVDSLLGISGGKAAGEGVTIKLGGVLALSGQGSFYGKERLRAISLAEEEIKAAGGPTFEFEPKDNKSGNAQAGATAMRELGTEGYPVALVDYDGDFGATLPGAEEYKILSIDGGGGATPAQIEKPYFYGWRNFPSTAPVYGQFAYIKATQPKIKKVAMIAWNGGSELSGPEHETYTKASAKYGLTSVGYHEVEVGETDFSNVIAELQQEQPEVILSHVYSPELGDLVKQLAAAGIEVPVLGSDWTSEVGEVGGEATKNLILGFDYFNAEKPENEWAGLLVREYEKKYGAAPGYSGANLYEDMFVVWQLAREVIAANGDLGSGEAYLEALENNPSFPSLYGGEGGKVGTMEIDLKTHVPAKRIMGIYTMGPNGSDITQVATFNVEGKEFKMLK